MPECIDGIFGESPLEPLGQRIDVLGVDELVIVGGGTAAVRAGRAQRVWLTVQARLSKSLNATRRDVT